MNCYSANGSKFLIQTVPSFIVVTVPSLLVLTVLSFKVLAAEADRPVGQFGRMPEEEKLARAWRQYVWSKIFNGRSYHSANTLPMIKGMC